MLQRPSVWLRPPRRIGTGVTAVSVLLAQNRPLQKYNAIALQGLDTTSMSEFAPCSGIIFFVSLVDMALPSHGFAGGGDTKVRLLALCRLRLPHNTAHFETRDQ